MNLKFILFFMRILLLISLLLISLTALNAQAPQRASSKDVYFKIKQLNHLANVLYVAAHPDDENTHLLTYLIHEEGVNATYYSLTRGDGGQNILGKDLGVALGITRTMEMYEARKIDGAKQKFGTALDFGFSKNPEETFNFWDKNKLVQETVDLIQELKPELIICRFPTTGEGGHGHHTASAIVALEAYKQIQKHNKSASQSNQLWEPKRILFNSYSFRSATTIKKDHLQLPLNQFNPILGKAYSQVAGESRSVHHSQGAGTPQRLGETTEYFGWVAGAQLTESIWDGIDKSWNKVKGVKVQQSISKLLKDFDFVNPAAHLGDIISIRKMILAMPEHNWKQQKLNEIDDILLDIIGLRLEFNTAKESYVTGDFKEIEIKALQQTDLSLVIKQLEIDNQIIKDPSWNFKIPNNQLHDQKIKLPTSLAIDFSEVYWLANENEKASFPMEIEVTFLIDNDIEITRNYPVTHYYLDPIWGDKYQFTRIEPDGAIEVNADFLLRDKNGQVEIPLWLKIDGEVSEVSLELQLNGKMIAKKQVEWTTQNNGVFHLWELQTDVNNHFEEGNYDLVLKWKDETTRKVVKARGVQKLVKYDHIPIMPYFKESKVKIINNDFKHQVRSVGYIDGVGDMVSGIMELIGLDVTIIDPVHVKNVRDLEKYETIVIGIRAYNRITALNDIDHILKEYVYNGGRLMVQYNTNHELINEDIGFKSLTLSRDRVTEENSEVKFINPSHIVLNYPHQITQDDFKGWVQERGLYFPSKWDKSYEAILEMGDTGEKASQGALLVLPYGKGGYIYTGLSFFRQLPAGHKGAMKLFLNLLEFDAGAQHD